MKLKRIMALIIALVMVLIVLGPIIVLNGNMKAENKVIYALNTVINITAYGKNSEDALKAVNNRIYEIDRQFNAFNENSQVAMINEYAGIEPVKVTADVFYVIENALKISEMTDGAFDITVKPVVDLWQVNEGGRVPEENEIENALNAVGYENIEIDPAMRSVYLKNKDMKIDLGGIAKGYAGDEVRRILTEYGVKSAVCDLGGNVVVVGEKPSLFGFGKNWKVGIKTPFSSNGEYLAVLEDKDTALVTSGAYERFFEDNGKIYHHIIDPKTGYPSQSDIVSATIVCENSMIADALSTAVFVMGYEKGMALVNSIPDCELICIGVSEKIFKTGEINLVITDDKYELG